MVESTLAGIADILPPSAPPDEPGLLVGWLLLALPLLLWWAWQLWRRHGRFRWQLWRLRRAVLRHALDTRRAADRLSTQLQGRPLEPAIHDLLNQARFAAGSINRESFLDLLQQLEPGRGS